MSSITLQEPKVQPHGPVDYHAPPPIPGPYLETDDMPMETFWHKIAGDVLIHSIYHHFRNRDNFFAGGNTFIYFSKEQLPNKGFLGPDFFFVDGVTLDKERPYWSLWDEGGHFPDVIIELASPSTSRRDRNKKKEIYQNTFKTHEYFIYDPRGEKLEGWRLSDEGEYESLDKNTDGRLYSTKLGVWIGPWTGQILRQTRTVPRFFDETGALVLMADEYEKKARIIEAQRAERVEARWETEKKRADTEKKRAESEKKRANAKARENEQLKKRIKELEDAR